jgi:antitoxin ParD1/3/4
VCLSPSRLLSRTRLLISLGSGMILSYFIRNRRKCTTMRNAEKVTITMTADLLQSVRDTVEAGEFATTSEAMRDAVRVWQRQRLEDSERLNAMRARIRRSLEDPRPSLSAEEAEAEMSRFMKGQEKAARNATR